MAKLFISHSHKDEDLVSKFVELLEAQFFFDQDDLRCTSHPSYGIVFGDDPVGTLKKDLSNDCVVLGVFSHNSLSSPWVNAELGAAWIRGSRTVPLLCGNVVWTNVAGPLFARANPVSLTNREHIRTLLMNLQQYLTWKPRVAVGTLKAGNVEGRLNAVVETAAAIRVHFPPERLAFRRDLFSDEHLLRWSDIRDRNPDKVFVWGWSCVNTVSAQNKKVFTNLVDRVSELNFLALSPAAVKAAAAQMNFGVVCDRNTQDVADDIENAFSNIRTHLINQLAPNQASRVSLRITDWFMAWSGVAIDPDKDDGTIQVEFYQYGNPENRDQHLDYRPNLVVTRQSQFYAGFWKSLKKMWDAAKPVHCST